MNNELVEKILEVVLHRNQLLIELEETRDDSPEEKSPALTALCKLDDDLRSACQAYNESKDECVGCDKEIDIFAKLIGEEYVCGDCAEPYLKDWFGKNGPVEMDEKTQKHVIENLLSKKKYWRKG